MRKQKTWMVLILCMGIGLFAALAVDRYLLDLGNRNKPVLQPAPPPVRPEKKTSPSLPDNLSAFFLDREDVGTIPPDLRAHDRIDILAVDRLPGSSKGSIARMILENIQVHQVIFDSSTRTSSPYKIKGFGLLLTPGQSIVLTSILNSSDIRLTRRNPNDTRTTREMPLRYTPRDGISRATRPWSHDRHRITPGMRAFTVSVQESDGISAQTRPGDRVDVMFSVSTSLVASEMQGTAEGTTSRKAGENKFSRIFLENITVLATEQSYRQDPADRDPVNLLVLEVTPEDAEKMAMMVDTQSGIVLRLIARNPKDKTLGTGKGYNFNRLLHQRDVASRISVIRNGVEIKQQTFYK